MSDDVKREVGRVVGLALSRTMQEVVEQMKTSGGDIHREPGGFWRIKNVAVKWWETPTVNALVKRGVLEYCDHKQRSGGHGSFPIRARIASNTTHSSPTRNHS